MTSLQARWKVRYRGKKKKIAFERVVFLFARTKIQALKSHVRKHHKAQINEERSENNRKVCFRNTANKRDETATLALRRSTFPGRVDDKAEELQR